ncbi:MAG TPA: GDSL-type esterase/lipase family protein [Actinomycetota bacterium]|nr:GDSL-type esterase/lipase family protein [Actinomycetota bacterium]
MTSTALAAALVLALAPVTPSSSGEPTRVLLVGDSVMQGSSGDWTWRYRLWQHLTATGQAVDLVGPRDDLYDESQPGSSSHDYVDPAFDADHAAYWRTAFASQKYPVAGLVNQYHPDVVVVGLGLNDLIGYWLSATAVLQEARSFVEQARSADPEVDVVIVGLPQTWTQGVEEFNAGLPALAQDLDTASARVLVTVPDAMVRGEDTYDPAHLAASGEVKMAAAVADALAVLGIGDLYPRPLPQVPNGPRSPAVLTMEGAAESATLSWTNPPGATGEYVWLRDVSTDSPWHRATGPVAESTWRATGLQRGHDYAFRLQATKGTAVANDVFSNEVVLTRRPPRIALVQVTSRRRALSVRWWPRWPVAADVQYTVSWRRAGERGRQRVRRTASTRVTIRRLVTHRLYRLTVRAWKGDVPGPRTRFVGIPLPPLR